MRPSMHSLQVIVDRLAIPMNKVLVRPCAPAKLPRDRRRSGRLRSARVGVPLRPVDSLTITTLVDNVYDVFVPVQRPRTVSGADSKFEGAVIRPSRPARVRRGAIHEPPWSRPAGAADRDRRSRPWRTSAGSS